MSGGQPLGIALVGAGQIGRRHAEHIRASSEARLAAIVDPSPGAAEFAAAEGVPLFHDLDALFAVMRPDGVLVATPNNLHVAHGLRVIEAGLPVLVEKPLSNDLEAGLMLVEAGEKAGVPVLTGHHRRHNPMIARAKAIVESGRLGRLVAAHGFFWLKKPDDYFAIEWRRKAGAGPILTNLIHDIDLLRHLCGEIASVQAITSNAVRGNEVEESAALLFRFAGGALGTFSLSDAIVAPWSWEHTASEFTAYPRTDQTCLFLGGTAGSLSIPRLEMWRNPGVESWFEPFAVSREIAPEEDPLRRQIAQFCRVIRGEEAPLVSGREGWLTLRVVDAVRRAAASGKVVEIG